MNVLPFANVPRLLYDEPGPLLTVSGSDLVATVPIVLFTVVDAATIVNDAMETFLRELESTERMKGIGLVMQGYSNQEKYELIKELIHPWLHGMFVTPKDIDETVKNLSYTISEGLNKLFAGN